MGLNVYPLFKKLLFILEAEKAHHLGLKGLKLADDLKLNSILFGKNQSLPVTVMGIDFPNPVGLAAGLDKNGDFFEALSSCGFGFVEIGTVTPRLSRAILNPEYFVCQKRKPSLIEWALIIMALIICWNKLRLPNLRVCLESISGKTLIHL